MKKFIYLFGVPVLFFSLFSVGLGQETTDYVPLAPIPGFTPGTGDQALGQYINSLYRLSIGLGAVLAVLMIVVGVLQYMSTDAFSGKSAGKTRIQQALMGLGLLLASFIILNTINPELLDLNVELTTATSTATLSGLIISFDEYCIDRTRVPGTPVETAIPTASQRGDCYRTESECNLVRTRNGATNESVCTAVPRSFSLDGEICPDCEEIRIPVAPANANRESCAGQAFGNPCTVSSVIADELVLFHDYVTRGDLNGFVSEGFPPTYNHENACHAAGTCIDYDIANIEGNFQEIAYVLESAKGAGLNAVYETNNLTEYSAFVELYPKYADNAYCGTAITGPHFSVYQSSSQVSDPGDTAEKIKRSTERCKRE